MKHETDTTSIQLSPAEIHALLDVYSLADPKHDSQNQNAFSFLKRKGLIEEKYCGNGKEGDEGKQWYLTAMGITLVKHFIGPFELRVVIVGCSI